ncbi:hypothetical protein N7493_010972 [Penicillium malachiteum]|uniref:tripeptidyl-peptidase II n=1 Tax=Penicillium malachiteum TaxID=1324776 RepID=A0AAD6MQN4_9EURO|nr:hypothetical protein N7493_010972 [Penicillium malachiteum]
MDPRIIIKIFVLFWAQVCIAGSSYQIVEQLEDAPFGWMRGSKPSASDLIKFRLAVDSVDIAGFQQTVIDLSTPGHPSYGQHMSLDQVRQALQPSAKVSNRIISWLNSENISSDSIEIGGNWITFQTAVSQAERMLNAEFFYYKNNETDTKILRTLKYSVPSDIHPDIQLIEPTTRFGNLGSVRMSRQEQSAVPIPDNPGANCGTIITPNCLRSLYGVHDAEAVPDARNRLGIAGFLEEYAHHSDFFHFIQLYAPNQLGANFSVVYINGGENDENSTKNSVEANLDVQYSITMAYDVIATFYTTAGRGPLIPDGDQPNANQSSNEPYLEQLHYITALPDKDLPAILTMSYGESEQSVPKAYASAVCNLFAQLGARGVTVIFSSGDSGPGQSCQSNDGSYRVKFLPSWPASCPFVTSVGGTVGVNPERAIDLSGGGFSEYFQRPSYQDHMVESYFRKIGDQWRGLYNTGGRGIPDVAAQASSFSVRDHGTYLNVGGTRSVSLTDSMRTVIELTFISASAPVVAGILSQLNSVRLLHGKSRMGFINPWLYTVGRAGLTDIIEGGSAGCYRSPIHNAGWNATVGWDPATGLGTPDFQKLAQLALQ